MVIGLSVGGGVAVVAIIAVVVILLLTRTPGYEKPVKDLISAINNRDVMAILDTVPLEEAVDSSDAMSVLGMDYDSIMSMYEELMQSQLEATFSGELGDDFSLSYKVYGTEEMTASEISDLNSQYTAQFATPDDFIDDAMRIDFDLIVDSEDGSDVESVLLTLVQVDGDWYIDLFSLD